MKTVTIFFNNGTMKKFKVNGMNFYKDLVLDVELFVDGETVAEFNSEHIAGYTIEDCEKEVEKFPSYEVIETYKNVPTETEFQRKADASFAEGCYLDQGITQVF